jgi:hypothetical protein
MPDTTATDQALLKAMDFLTTLRKRWKGTKVDLTQTLQWPRSGVYIDDEEWDEELIPEELKSGQIQLAYEALSTDLQPTGTGQEPTREKVDVIEVEYARRGTGTITPQFNKAMAFLDPLLSGNTGGFSVEAIRS